MLRHVNMSDSRRAKLSRVMHKGPAPPQPLNPSLNPSLSVAFRVFRGAVKVHLEVQHRDA